MGSFSLVHWLIVILVVILLFGRGRISDLMGDMAKGINSFKKGLADDGTPPAYPPPGYAPPTAYAPPHIAPPTAVPPAPVRDEVPRS
jgi:sec-independent protein translocase protein TatA